MNTIILFWNPDISSYTIERLREDLSNYAHVGNWSVWEHDKAHKGDRFFMVRCGEGKTGICMSGRFRSEPYQDEDWSGKGREVYYMDLRADTVIDPDLLPILSTELLSKKIPSFDWSGGHSGRVLPVKEAKKLERLWKKFLEQNYAIFGKLTLQTYLGDAEIEEEEKTCFADIELTCAGGFEIYCHNPEVSVTGFDLDSLKEEFAQKMTDAGNTKPIEYRIFNFSDSHLFFKVMDIAKKAYAGMNDEFGEPYLKRAIREHSGLYTDTMLMVGLLQYVLKNPKITPTKLLARGIPKAVVDTVVILQQKEDEDFEQYVQRAAKNSFAEHILYQIIEHRLDISFLPEITIEQYSFLVQNLKAYHYLEEKRKQKNKRAEFDRPAKEFEMWCSLNDNADIFAIRGEYSDEDVAEMSRVLEKLTYGKFYVDISELNIHREAKYDRLIRTYEDDIIQRLYYNEEIPLLEKMIINRKHGNIFEKDGRKIFCDNGKVLVHIPIDQEVEINEAVEIIGRTAVIGNQTLKTLEFPSNVHIIDDYAFAYCEDLSIVRMHDGITSIGENSFDSCSIKQLRLSSSLSEIPVAAFKYNEDLETIEIPASVKHIGEEAFLCDYIEDVVIPEGVETIDYAVFTRTLKHINLPSTLKWIAYDFYYEYGIDDPERTKPYVDIHPDNPVYYSKGGILYSRETGKEVLGKAGRTEKER